MSELLPTGTVTLLLADVEGSTRLWEIQPGEMPAAVAQLDRAVSAAIVARGGVRPVDQGEGDSFVVAFARASDAVACALELQCAPLAPIRLRIGVHSGEVQLRDEGNYIGQTVNRAARLRDLAHGGQTVLSGTTGDLVADRLPPDTWLIDLGSHQLRDLPRPERVMQLCHRELDNEFPLLRTTNTAATHNLPVQLTSFVGRGAEMVEVRQILADNRLVTLTGAGGAGKTRLAVQIAAQIAGEFGAGVWCADLAPITDPSVVPVAVARALGLPDQPGRSTLETLTRVIAERQMLMLLDNCEHLLDACAALIVELSGSCPALTLLATSREPIGVAGEVTWQVPSLSLTDEAIELFTDRARRVRPDFSVTDDTAVTVEEICRRLDGMPLAIELAAARVRALSVAEILGSLHDRFRLLTGGGRTAVRRQQTLRASVDWSHALLTEPEFVLFRRLAVFMGGFDLEAAQEVTASGDVERYQVLDQLTLLVDKSLVVADDAGGRTRYRLLETVRQYALEKLGESGDADTVRTRHRDHYTGLAGLLDAPVATGHQRRVEQAEIEIDNLRAAFGWSRENLDIERALELASSLQPLWLTRGRLREGLSWIDEALTALDTVDCKVAPAVLARALADAALLDGLHGVPERKHQANEALAIARQLDDPSLLVRALTACCGTAAFSPEHAAAHFAEAIELARVQGDKWRLSQLLGFQAYASMMAGDAVAAHAVSEEGRDLADSIGDRFASGMCRVWGAAGARAVLGDLHGAEAELAELIADSDAAGDPLCRFNALITQSFLMGWQGKTTPALAAAEIALERAAELGVLFEGQGYLTLGGAHIAAGEVASARDAFAQGWSRLADSEFLAMNMRWRAETELAAGDLDAARSWAEKAVTSTAGCFQMMSMIVRARVALAEDDAEAAERDVHDALCRASDIKVQLNVPDIFEILAQFAALADSCPEAARLCGAAHAIRQRTGEVRYRIYQADHEAWVTSLRDAMGENNFDVAWVEGAALSIEEAVAYAQRGRGERKRPRSGWASLTPTEHDVIRLVSDGLANKAIATRLFVSPRTVQTHLTHVYAKLGLTSRVQLVQEASRHT